METFLVFALFIYTWPEIQSRLTLTSVLFLIHDTIYLLTLTFSNLVVNTSQNTNRTQK